MRARGGAGAVVVRDEPVGETVRVLVPDRRRVEVSSYRNRYICISGLSPSGGVDMLALLT
jgi:hypothetical protein